MAGTSSYKKSSPYDICIPLRELLYMHLGCEVNFSDFAVWTSTGLHVERIMPFEEFFQDNVKAITKFYKHCILPELTGKWYTKQSVLPQPTQQSATNSMSSIDKSSSDVFCYCGGPEEGTMIACDLPECKIEWFHLSCLQLNSVPKGKWYCPDCRKKST